MRKITVTESITLDGVMQGPGGVQEDRSQGFKFGGWSGPFNDKEGGEFVMKELKQNAEYIFGQTTFDIWTQFWPLHADLWPSVNKNTKYVMTKDKNKKTDWKNTVFIDSIEDIKKLKKSEGLDIQVWGSSQIVQLLLENDLVDTITLKIHPITLGSGKKLFGDGVIPATFKLVDTVITSTGVIIATYERSGEIEVGLVGESLKEAAKQ